MTAKYGVAQLAKAMGVEVATARGRLRAGKIKKGADGKYGWNSDKEMKAVADKIKATAPAGRPAKKAAKVVAKGKAKLKPAKSTKKAAQAEASAAA